MADRLVMLFRDHAEAAHAASAPLRERAFDRAPTISQDRQEQQKTDNVFRTLIPEIARAAHVEAEARNRTNDRDR